MHPQSKPEQIIRLILRTLRHYIYRLIDMCTPYITYRKYLGFKLYYSRGTGLIERIRFLSPKKIYEQHVCDALVEACRQVAHKTSSDISDRICFVDIGVNIGLISLYLKAKLPGITIYAFEPGIRQRAQLELTVATNNLSDSIHVLPYALSNEPGVGTFHTSIDDRAVGGDGILDTGRSNGSIAHTVEFETLDNIRARHNFVPHVIKIDIEGAELWALQGARQTIETYKPVVFFEMSPVNLKVYPYTADDIFTFWKDMNYEVTDLNGKPCTPQNFEDLAKIDDMFIARPAL